MTNFQQTATHYLSSVGGLWAFGHSTYCVFHPCRCRRLKHRTPPRHGHFYSREQHTMHSTQYISYDGDIVSLENCYLRTPFRFNFSWGVICYVLKPHIKIFHLEIFRDLSAVQNLTNLHQWFFFKAKDLTLALKPQHFDPNNRHLLLLSIELCPHLLSCSITNPLSSHTCHSK